MAGSAYFNTSRSVFRQRTRERLSVRGGCDSRFA